MDRRAFLSAALAGSAAGLAGVGGAETTTPPAFEPLGELLVEGTKEVVVSDDGTTAFLAVTDGFATVDLTDPAEPALLAVERSVFGEHEHGPLRQVWDVSYDAGDLVVASQNGADGTLYAFVVFDVRDPANPRRRAAREVAGPIHNCDLEEGHVYLTGNHRGHHESDTEESGTETRPRLPLEIYDVRAEPVRKVADWSPLDANAAWRDVPPGNRVIHDVSVVGERAYLAYWDAGAFVLDVTEPANPTLLSRVGEFTAEDLASMSPSELDAERTEGPAGNAHYVSASPEGSILAVGKEGWDDPSTAGGGPGGIDLYDATDPTAPVHAATIDPEPAPDETRSGVWTTAHNFEIRGDRLYSSWYRGGVKLHDVSTLEAPELLAWWLRPRARSFWTAQVGVAGEYFVAASAWDGSGQVPSSAEGLLTFPDRAGEQPDRPSLRQAVEPTGSETRSAGRTTRTDERGGAPSATRRAGTTAPPANTESEPTVPGGRLGYGALAALGGIGLWTLRALRRRP